MSRRRSAFVGGVVGTLLAVIVAYDAGAISSPSGIDPRLRFEWDVIQTRSGQSQAQGYIYNDYGRPAMHVLLLVETLDAGGQMTGQTYGYVFGVVPGFNRAPFDVRLTTTGASYRIRVTSFEWKDGGSGGM